MSDRPVVVVPPDGKGPSLVSLWSKCGALRADGQRCRQCKRVGDAVCWVHGQVICAEFAYTGRTVAELGERFGLEALQVEHVLREDLLRRMRGRRRR